MFGIGLGLMGARCTLRQFRIIPVSADEFYIVTRSSWGTALAHRIRRGVGGSAGSDVGTPWGVWRRAGTRELESFANDPASPLFTFSDDTGSFDYAMQEGVGSFRFGGSYHGGETNNTGGLIINGAAGDHTIAQTASSIAITRTSTIDYGGGRTMAVTYSLTFNRDGTLTEASTYNSSAAFASGQMAHMEIGQALFTRARAGTTMYDVSDAATSDVTLTGAPGDVTLFSPSTGHAIRCQSDAPTVLGANYNSTYISRTAAVRSKLYYRRSSTAGGPLGSYSVARTITFSKPGVATLDADFAENITGWTQTSTNVAAWTASNGGAMRQTRDATNETRYTSAAINCEIGQTYQVQYGYVLGGGAVTHAGGYVVVGLSASGSTAGALLNNLVNSAADRRMTFVATQAQHWLTLRQGGGTVGETIDWQFVTVTKVRH